MDFSSDNSECDNICDSLVVKTVPWNKIKELLKLIKSNKVSMTSVSIQYRDYFTVRGLNKKKTIRALEDRLKEFELEDANKLSLKIKEISRKRLNEQISELIEEIKHGECDEDDDDVCGLLSSIF